MHDSLNGTPRSEQFEGRTPDEVLTLLLRCHDELHWTVNTCKRVADGLFLRRTLDGNGHGIVMRGLHEVG